MLLSKMMLPLTDLRCVMRNATIGHRKICQGPGKRQAFFKVLEGNLKGMEAVNFHGKYQQ